MNGYAEILQEIEKNNEELRNLNRSRDAIKNAEKDMPREEFQKELSTVERFLASEQLKLENNKNIIQSYDNAYFLINDLDRLNKATEGIRDFQDRDERNAEIEAKRRELTANMQSLPLNLQNELRNRILAERTATITPEKNNEIESTEPSMEMGDEIVSQEEPVISASVEQVEPVVEENNITEETPIITNDLADETEINQVSTDKPDVNFQEDVSDLPVIDKPEEAQVTEESTTDLSEPEISNEPEMVNGPENEAPTDNNLAVLENELNEARREYQDSIARFQRIFAAELNEATTEGPFNEVELQNFNNKYSTLKVNENERMLAARNNIERLESELQAAREAAPQLVRNYEGRRLAPEPFQDDPNYVGKRLAPEPVQEDPNYVGKRLAPEPVQDDPNYVGKRLAPEPVQDDPNYVGKRLAPEPVQDDPNYVGKRLAPEPVQDDPNYVGKRLAPEPVQDDPNYVGKRLAPEPTQPEPSKENGDGQTPSTPGLTTPHDEQIGLPPHTEPKEEPVIDNTPTDTKGTGEPPLALPPHVDPPVLPPHQDPPALPPHVEPPVLPPKPTPKEEVSTRGFDTIIYELTKDLDVKKGDAKKYTASNIKVFKGFCNELQAKNTIYNIFHFVPAIIKVPINLVRKLANKVTYSIKDKQRIKELKERIDKLSESDVEIILREYKGSRVIQEKLPTILNVLLNEKIQKHLNTKLENKNEILERKYLTLINAAQEVEECNKRLATEKDPEKIKAINNIKNSFLKASAQDIAMVRKTYDEANALVSGGAHGFEEDMRAAGTKMSRVGMSFAKDYDLDHELQQKLAELEQQEKLAIQKNDNEAALKAFMARVELLSRNTKIENSIVGKRDVGKKVFLPFGGEINYNPNPLVKDILTTLTVVTSAVSAVSALKTHGPNGSSQTELQNEIQRVNDANDKVIRDVNAQGAKLEGNRDTITEGMNEYTNQSVVNATTTTERMTADRFSDSSGWRFGADYNHADALAHQQYNAMADQIKSQIEDIARQSSKGMITDQQALEMLKNVSNQQQRNLINVYTEYQPILKEYAATHTFDLHGLNESMEQVLANPDAIIKMNDAMVGTVEIGEHLMGLEAEHVSAFLSLPSDLRQTLTANAAAAVLAYNVAKDVDAKAKARNYGNEVTDMVQQYIDNKDKSASNENEKSSGRSK